MCINQGSFYEYMDFIWLLIWIIPYEEVYETFSLVPIEFFVNSEDIIYKINL